jgi:threonine aldolase
LCHENAHIQHDECGAVEFMTGGKLVLLPSENGKLSAKDIDEKMTSAYPHGYHNSLITSVSLAQATEYGTIYTPAELKSITLVAKNHGLNVHVDGARFANALATLKCTPAELTWKAGIDIMSFGSSKNGTMNAEAIIVFSENANKDIKRKLKRSGQLVSKMRYISCQLEAYLYKNRWLNWANKANQLALNLSNEIKELQSIQVIYPVQTNSLVIKMTDELADYLLDKGINFYPWSGSKNCYRLVLSNMNKQSDINFFVESVKAWQN